MSLLARLIEAGTPADLIEEVAMMIAEKRAADRAVEDARAKARERQARKRERDQSRDVTECHVTECDSVTAPPLSPPNDIYSNPPLNPPSSKSSARKGSRLPDDWQPKPLPSDLAAAVAKWPEGELTKQQAMFRDWAASAPGAKGIKSDWDAAYRNWLRRIDGERPRNNSSPRQAPSNSNTLKLTREKLHGTGY